FMTEPSNNGKSVLRFRQSRKHTSSGPVINSATSCVVIGLHVKMPQFPFSNVAPGHEPWSRRCLRFGRIDAEQRTLKGTAEQGYSVPNRSCYSISPQSRRSFD